MGLKTATDKLKSSLRQKPVQQQLTDDRWLSTGSTLLNLACSGRPDGGFFKGGYFFFVGDSVSGKTFVALTCLAEASINRNFDGYRFIYDAVERGALMDFSRFFGESVAARVEPPECDGDGSPVYSDTAESFYFHLDDAFKKDKPFIYILDSQDALSSEAELSKFDDRKVAYRKGKETTGTFGDAKAKVHSQNIRRVIGRLEKTGSILIMLNQTRDSFDLFVKSNYSGGRALRFYAAGQLWSSVAGKIEKQIRGKKRELGIISRVKVVKNRVNGRIRTVTLPIYHSYGIADLDSMVDYLVDEGVWVDSGGTIKVTGLGPAFSMKKEQLIRRIEEEDEEEDVRGLVVETWEEIERLCEIRRRKKYQ